MLDRDLACLPGVVVRGIGPGLLAAAEVTSCDLRDQIVGVQLESRPSAAALRAAHGQRGDEYAGRDVSNQGFEGRAHDQSRPRHTAPLDALEGVADLQAPGLVLARACRGGQQEREPGVGAGASPRCAWTAGLAGHGESSTRGDRSTPRAHGRRSQATSGSGQ